MAGTDGGSAACEGRLIFLCLLTLSRVYTKTICTESTLCCRAADLANHRMNHVVFWALTIAISITMDTGPFSRAEGPGKEASHQHEQHTYRLVEVTKQQKHYNKQKWRLMYLILKGRKNYITSRWFPTSTELLVETTIRNIAIKQV